MKYPKQIFEMDLWFKRWFLSIVIFEQIHRSINFIRKRRRIIFNNVFFHKLHSRRKNEANLPFWNFKIFFFYLISITKNRVVSCVRRANDRPIVGNAFTGCAKKDVQSRPLTLSWTVNHLVTRNPLGTCVTYTRSDNVKQLVAVLRGDV